jgi:formylglycine-generating enzyme required for sulfatase activity
MPVNTLFHFWNNNRKKVLLLISLAIIILFLIIFLRSNENNEVRQGQPAVLPEYSTSPDNLAAIGGSSSVVSGLGTVLPSEDPAFQTEQDAVLEENPEGDELIFIDDSLFPAVSAFGNEFTPQNAESLEITRTSAGTISTNPATEQSAVSTPGEPINRPDNNLPDTALVQNGQELVAGIPAQPVTPATETSAAQPAAQPVQPVTPVAETSAAQPAAQQPVQPATPPAAQPVQPVVPPPPPEPPPPPPLPRPVAEQDIPTRMVWIRSGIFEMGSPESELNREIHETQQQVTVKSFFMGIYPVTQREFEQVMGRNPSYFRGPDLPVENVSWFDAVYYCNRLSIQSGFTPAYTIIGSGANRVVFWNQNANGYRLPTETEWEYACRAGTTTPFNTGDSITRSQANFFSRGTTDVGSFAPNAWGLHDMHGNVAEWCWDSINLNLVSQRTQGSSSTEQRNIFRGGSWLNTTMRLRSAFRDHASPHHRSMGIGFRVVRNTE